MIHIKLQASPGSSLIKQMNLADFNATSPAFAEGRPVSEPLDCRALLTDQLLADFPGSKVLWASLKWPGHPSNDLLTEGYSLFSLLFLFKTKQNTNNKKSENLSF